MCAILFCFASLLLFLGAFSLWYAAGESSTRDAPPCGCLPLSLFKLIAVPLSLLLYFIPLCGALFVLVLALSSYLCCLALLIDVYGCLSCPTRIICGYPGLFRFCSLVFPLLNPPLAMMSFAGYFHARFLLSAFFPVCWSYFVLFFFPTVFVPDLFWCKLLYLVTTAGFVADQLIM